MAGEEFTLKGQHKLNGFVLVLIINSAPSELITIRLEALFPA